MSDFKNLLTDDELKTVNELKLIVPKIKNKYFSLGTDLNTFIKLLDKIEIKK